MINMQQYASRYEPLRDEVKEAVHDGKAVREKVRQATLRALADGKLEFSEIRSALNAAVEGAASAAPAGGKKIQAALKEAVEGLEDALAQAALALQFAGAEAATRARKYRGDELRRALADLRALESLLLDAVESAARDAKREAGGIFAALSHHMKHSGTAAGRSAGDAIASLRPLLGDAVKSETRAGAHAVRAASATLAQAASGILAGVADALEPPKRP